MTLKIGMIGAGWVSAHHLRGYADLAPRAKVVAIADPNEDARLERARAFDIPAVYASAEEMLVAGDLDAVDITSPREWHAPHVLLAAAHGLPVMCQKPLAPTYAEARQLVDSVADKVPLMVHENWRWRPHYRQIKAWLDAGLVGEILHVDMQILTSGLLPDADGRRPALVRQPMMRDLERLLVMEVMIHHIDCLRFLLGDLDLLAARHRRTCPEVRGEDYAGLCLSTETGAMVHLVGNFCAHGAPPQQRDQLSINGAKGSIYLRGDDLSLTAPDGVRISLDLDANYTRSYRDAIAHFLDGLEGGRPFETNPHDNLKTLNIVEDVYSG